MTTHTDNTPAVTQPTMLAEEFAPRYDVIQAEHLVVDAEPARTYAATRQLDFTDVRGPLVDAVSFVRGLPERVRNRGQAPPRGPTRMTFDDMAAGSDWVILGEHPGHEIAAGVGGRFWLPNAQWRRVEPEDFVAFNEPGYGKLVMSLSVRPYGTRQSLVSYDVRVTCNDTLSQAKFALYWKTVAAFVRSIQKATLNTIKRHAEQPLGTV